MNGRWYAIQIVYLLSPDPILQAPGHWLNFNRYAYVFNTPFKYVDPSGNVAYLARERQRRESERLAASRRLDLLAKPRGASFSISRSGAMAAGAGMNGVGLDGVYYDWFSSTYRTLDGAEANMSGVNFIHQTNGRYTTIFAGSTANSTEIFRGVHFGGGKTWYKEDGLAALGTLVASSQGGFVGGDTWNSTSNHLNGAGFTVAGAEYSGSRALSRTMKYVSSASKTTPTEVMFKVPGGSVYASTRFVSNATKVLKVGGAATGVLGVGMTGYEIYTGQKSLMGEEGLDLIMGGVAFIPGGGWIVSGAYFGGKYLLEATGNDFWNEP
ncbi:MAG: hypothetical protein ACK5HT_20300 [Draconibacterium sp.]